MFDKFNRIRTEVINSSRKGGGGDGDGDGGGGGDDDDDKHVKFLRLQGIKIVVKVGFSHINNVITSSVYQPIS
jgi:hypothetical protein